MKTILFNALVPATIAAAMGAGFLTATHFHQILAAISGESVIQTLIYLIVVGLCFWLLWWLLAYCAVPEPFNKVARVILAVAAVIFLINILLGLAGHPIINWKQQ